MDCGVGGTELWVTTLGTTPCQRMRDPVHVYITMHVFALDVGA